MDLFREAQIFIPITVFIGGLVGSLHCMSMCGPIVLNFAKKKSWLACYQFGRMLSYTLLGSLFGAFGNQFLGPQAPTWLSSLSLILIAAFLIFNSLKIFKGQSLHFPMPPLILKTSTQFWRWIRISQLPKDLTSGLAGFVTVFLPCGHLYSFLAGALATGSAIKGAAFMFAFWLGSTPLLSISTRFFHFIFPDKIFSQQKWAASLLMLAGFTSLIAFASMSNEMAQAKIRTSETKGQMLCH